ncbi:MAG: TolC family protein [Breznakibacter sp.]
MFRKGNAVAAVVFTMWLVAPNVAGQSELTKLISYALEHSHDVKKSQLQIEEADYLRREARSQGLPQIEGTASYSKMMLELDLPASVYSMVSEEYAPIIDQIANIDALYTASMGVQVTQLIYSQAYWIGLKTARKNQELQTILKSKTDEEVIGEVANAYYQTGSLMLQEQTIEGSLNSLRELYKITELNYRSDLIKETDLNRLKVTLTNMEVSRQTIVTGIDIQLNYLKALAGMPADSVIRIDASYYVENFRNTVVSPLDLQNVPAYQVLVKQDEIAAQQVKAARANYYPTLAAYGQFDFSSYNTSSKVDELTNMNTIGLNLKVPIFTSGQTHAKVKQAMLQKSQLNEEMLKYQKLLSIDYKNALSELQTASGLVTVQKENRELAQKVYHQTLLQYREGMASMADVLNVNFDLLQADNTYNQQVLKCRMAEVKMLKATGTLLQLGSGD